MTRGWLFSMTLFLAAATTPAWADSVDNQALFQEANGAYGQGNYQDAAKSYETVLKHLKDGAVYLNLGNAYYRQDQFGHAVHAYRQGLRLEPPARIRTSLNRNLETTQSVLRSRYKSGKVKSQLMDNESLLYTITHAIGRELLTTSFLVFWLMFLTVLCLRRLRKKMAGLGVSAITTGLAALILGLMLWGQVHSEQSIQSGIVLGEGTILREAPGKQSDGEALPEGIEVRIIDGNDTWIRIALKNEREGWVQSQDIGQL